VLENGLALLGGARCQQAAGGSDEVSGLLERAQEVFEQLGAQPLLAVVDGVLGTKRSASIGR
jgi:hypothetical protein